MLPSLLSGGAPNKFDVQPSVEGSGDAGESREARRLAVARLQLLDVDQAQTGLASKVGLSQSPPLPESSNLLTEALPRRHWCTGSIPSSIECQGQSQALEYVGNNGVHVGAPSLTVGRDPGVELGAADEDLAAHSIAG